MRKKVLEIILIIIIVASIFFAVDLIKVNQHEEPIFYTFLEPKPVNKSKLYNI